MSILKELETPVFYAEGEPTGVTRENYQLVVDGLIEGDRTSFTFQDVENMPMTTENVRLTSVSGWTVRANWQGVRFTEFLKHIHLKPEATHVNFESFGGYTTCLPLEELKKENVLLCYKVEGEYLEMEYGAPLRTLVPHKWGYKSIKGLARISFTDRQIPGYWETRGYTDHAEIEPGAILDINSGQMKQIRGGEVTEF
jgi:DMSO/TMAO reductase YedYZ molybdopterin-dependent catalytic subunit